MAIQTVNGKGFEYAVCDTMRAALIERNQQVEIVKNDAYINVEAHFNSITDQESKNKMLKAAKASINSLFRFEPNLSNGDDIIKISIQKDSSGIAGDVRDVVFKKENSNWCIGVSCKHNHRAVKHSRLSNTIDFGQDWLGYPCSKNYFNQIGIVFDRLTIIRDSTKHLPPQQKAKWNIIDNKNVEVCLPILMAFKDELYRLNNDHPDVPTRLLEYLLGSKDFYKVIAIDKEQKTIIQAYNIHDTLSLTAGNIRPINRSQKLSSKLPTQILDIRMKQNNETTLLVTLDNGWSLSLRIHNASSKIEPSLKFDINLTGVPSSLSNLEEYWQ